MNFFKINTITGKIILVTLMLVVFMAIAISVPYGIITYNSGLKKIESLKDLLYKDYDLAIKSEVEIAQSMILGVYKKYQSNELTEEEARLMAADLIRGLSYGDGGYFWIDTKQGDNVVLLGSATEGKNRLNAKDVKGNYLIKNIIKAALEGGGYTNYWFPKKGSDIPLPKRSYSSYFEPFEWVLGTGNYVDDIEERIKEEQDLEIAALKRIIWTIIIISLLVVALAVVGTIYFGRSFSKPIIHLVNKTKQLATGDLTVTFKRKRKDEIGTLQESLHITISKLREIIAEVVDGSSNVAAASSQMSKTAEHISQGANSQSASTEEISSSVEEMVANIESNTENSLATEQITLRSDAGMVKLQDAVKMNLEAMKDIRDKTNIINDIAAQTNMLALNAAVEAARAGEYGRGFAVVATEVRKLSDYTKKAASGIEGLTEESFTIAEDSWENMEILMPDIKATVDKIRDITLSSKEQNIGAAQINNAVQSLVGITSQNAAAAEQLASSSEQLSKQAEALKDIVAFFRIH